MSTPTEQLTFVLTLCGPRDIATARDNLLPSLDAFFDARDMAAVVIIAPEADCRLIESADAVSAGLQARIRVMSERAVVGSEPAFLRARGWHKQQILKLAISRQIDTRLYCTLDSDMYLVRPCSLADWTHQGKCIYNPEPVDGHSKWWKRAARQLGFDVPLDRDDGFGVTPALLYAELVRGLVAHLEHARGGLTRAIRRGATEYTLYWLYLRKHYSASDLYDRQIGRLYARCLWKRGDLAPADVTRFVDRQFEDPGRFFFSIIQSTSQLASDSVVRHVRTKIEARRRATAGGAAAC